MKSDLDQLMQVNQVDAIWVVGAAQHNPAMVYLTGGAHVTTADLIIRRGQKGVLFHGMMEREEAAKSGYDLVCYTKYPYKALLEQAAGDVLLAAALRMKMMCEDLNLTRGRVMLYGKTDVGRMFTVFSHLRTLLPELEIVGDGKEAVLNAATATKDADEIAHITNIGRITVETVERTRQFLMAHKAKNNHLVKADGSPLTIGAVRAQINLWLSELGAENPEGCIFAIGRDAGIPHSTGTDADLLELGKTIVFDIYPCEKGGGYFYDMTRTWSLGYATPEAKKLHQTVKDAYAQVTQTLKLGENAAVYQKRTCDIFEAQGHETINTNPQAESGYIHSLGHGVGLNIHEKPWFSREDDASNVLQKGTVFTIEPGLYYPEKGMGVRIEDTWYVDMDGTIKKFIEYTDELVLPIAEEK